MLQTVEERMGQVGRDTLRDGGAEMSWPKASDLLARLLADRFSCRGYRPDAVPKPVIRRMLTSAQMSASWCNSQPWEVIVTEGVGTERFRRALFDHAIADHTANNGVPRMMPDFPFPTRYRGVYKERQREVGWQLFESVGVAYGDRAASARQSLENFRLFGAPHMLLVTSEPTWGPTEQSTAGSTWQTCCSRRRALASAQFRKPPWRSIRRWFGFPLCAGEPQ